MGGEGSIGAPEPGPGQRETGSTVAFAIAVGTVLAFVPICWLDIYIIGAMGGWPMWGALLVAALLLQRGGVLRPLRGILIGLAIAFLACGFRFGLGRLGVLETMRDNQVFEENFEKLAAEERAVPDYQDRAEQVEKNIAQRRQSLDHLKRNGDWLFGAAYVFFSPLFLGLLGALVDFGRRRRMERRLR